ncbi:MAG TPA: hypothetical protein PLV39_10185 [Fimbriimonadaceae bacterium]|nr:hypothetical protein [Fimbriimonadaceae bacterium]
MNRIGWVVALALSLAAASCSPKEPATPDAALDPPAPTPEAGVQPLSPSAGPVTPMTGSESLQGAGGGGVQQAAKEKARETAAGKSRPTPPDSGDE